MTVKISQENGKAVVSVDGNEALKADADGNVEVVGKLGIGTSTPFNKLEVQDDIRVGNINVGVSGDSGLTDRIIRFNGGRALLGYIGAHLELRTGDVNKDVVVSPAGTERMRIRGDNGNVVVTNDLEVNGTTIAALIDRIEALEAGS